MLANVSALLALLYVPLMWALTITLLLVGLLGVLMPARLRRLLDMFTRNGPVRVLGVVMVILGAEMFIQARNTVSPMLVKTLGVLLFVDGGVGLIVPTLSVIFTEKTRNFRLPGLRFVGLLLIGTAWLFYLAAQLPPPPVI